MNWCEKVIKIMTERGISQKQLSEISGITESSISRYLHNNQRPRMDIVVNVAKALNTETEYFLDEDEKAESAYNTIATAIARKGSELSPEEKNKLISLILGAIWMYRSSDVYENVKSVITQLITDYSIKTL